MDCAAYDASSCQFLRRIEAMPVAEIVNGTQQVLDMKVGNSVYVVHLAQLGRGATHTVRVDNTDTYQEYEFSALRGASSDPAGKSGRSRLPRLVVTSDDCCDFKRITIKEVDGLLAVEHEPRWPEAEPREIHEAPKRQCDAGVLSWKWWIRMSIF